MRLRSLAGPFVVLLGAACGGSGSDGPSVGPSACDPIAQTGCGGGQRCGLIHLAGGAVEKGCVPVGTAGAGQACSFGAEGPATGYDTCGAGLACVGGTCRAVCALAGGTTCGTTRTCVAYAGVFDGDGAGVCDPTCNPVTQVRLTDGAAACGSPDPGNPTLGCYGAPGTTGPTVFTCAPLAAGAVDRVHRSAPIGPAGGGAYLNGCAPGYLPLLRASSADPSPVCIALCDPAETWQGSTAQRQGIPPRSCPDAGATNAGEECRFWWWLESGPAGQWSNAIGFCIDHTLYDATPSCADLPNTDTSGDGIPEHRSWGCAPLP